MCLILVLLLLLNKSNQWQFLHLTNYLIINLVLVDEMRNVNLANILAWATLNKAMFGWGWLGSAVFKLNLRHAVPNLWFLKCGSLNQFDLITVLPEEIILFVAIPFWHRLCILYPFSPHNVLEKHLCFLFFSNHSYSIYFSIALIIAAYLVKCK